MFEYILFDLDGTLTDPKEGICKSVQYALKKAGIDEPNLDVLEPFIGPPLMDSFKEFYGMDEENASKAVADYRERFSVTGLYENELYPEMDDMLRMLKDNGKKLAVASSKPEVFVKKILKHFKINKFFDVVVGSGLDGSRATKTEVVEEALRQLYGLKEDEDVKAYLDNNKLIRKSTVMVGDRKFDVVGAKAFGISTVGVSFGYAKKGELEVAGAIYIAKHVKDLGLYLISEHDKKKKQERLESKSSFFKSLNVLVPLVWYYFIMMFASFIGVLITNSINKSGDTDSIMWLSMNSVLVSGIIYLCSLILAIIIMVLLFRRTDEIRIRCKMISSLYIVSGGMLALSLNVILTKFATLTQFAALKYEESDMLKNLPVVMGCSIFVVLSPFLEELLFRWLIYGRMKKMLNTGMAVIISALFFGFYHGNLLQGIYAFIMGIVLALIYEKSGSVLSSLLFHMGANLFVYLIRYMPTGAQNILAGVGSAIAFLIAGAVITAYAYNKSGAD